MAISDDSVVLTLAFDVDGDFPPSFRQVASVFALLDEAAALAATSAGLVAAEVPAETIDDPLSEARQLLPYDDGSPRVIEISTGSIRIRTVISKDRVVVFLTAITLLFGAADGVVRGADQLVQDTSKLVVEVQQFGQSTQAQNAREHLQGGVGKDPTITISVAELESFASDP